MIHPWCDTHSDQRSSPHAARLTGRLPAAGGTSVRVPPYANIAASAPRCSIT